MTDGEGALDDNRRMIAGIERLPAFLIMREPGAMDPKLTGTLTGTTLRIVQLRQLRWRICYGNRGRSGCHPQSVIP